MALLTLPAVRVAARQMRRTPSITALAVISVAVGIGLATSAFTVVHGVFLRPLPVPDGDRIVRIWDFHRAGRYNVYISSEEFVRRVESARSFDGLAAYHTRNLPVESPGFATRVVRGAFISPAAFELLSVRAAMGRGLRSDDSAPNAPPVVVLADDVWRQQFGAAADIVGKSVKVGAEWRTVVGVMPRSVRFPEKESFWVPLQTTAATATDARLKVFGKLRSDVTMGQAEAELNAIGNADRSQRHQPGELVQRVMPFTRGGSGSDEAQFLVALVGVLTLLLVVAAANVANLMLARNATRMQELAVRSALGAGRAVLLWQLWLETFVLTAIGALAGVGGARVGLVWFSQVVSDLPWWADFRLSLPVIGYAFVLALLAATVAGLAPALKITRAPLAEILKTGSKSIAGVRFGRLSTAMIVAEFAISVGFLGGAAILGRGLLGFSYERFGLPAQRVLVAQLYFGQPKIAAEATREQRQAAWNDFERDADARRLRIQQALAATPGVRATAVASTFPGNEVEPSQWEIEGVGRVTARLASVGMGYFDILDSRVVSGRDFAASEYQGAAQSILINEPFARQHFAGRNPIGARLRMVDQSGSAQEWKEIIGVVPDLGLNPGDPTRAEGIYVPQTASNFTRLALRADGDPSALLPALHEAVLREAPNAHVQWAVTLEAQMREVAMIFRGIGAGLLAMGLIALLLSAAGIYAIVAFSVTQRTREMGIRLALGATSASLVRSIVGRPARQISLGAILGLGVAAAVMQLVKVIPFDLEPGGTLLTSGFVLAMIVAGLAACVVPARRAMRIHPMEAMRSE